MQKPEIAQPKGVESKADVEDTQPVISHLSIGVPTLLVLQL